MKKAPSGAKPKKDTDKERIAILNGLSKKPDTYERLPRAIAPRIYETRM